MTRDEYGAIDCTYLLNRVLQIYEYKVFLIKAKSVKAGENFCERMDEFYEWCYLRRII